MVYRKFNTVFNRILALIAIIAAVALSWSALSFVGKKSAHADEVAPQAQTQLTHDQVFGANHANSRPFSLSDEEIVHIEPGKYSWPDEYSWKSSTFHLTKDEVLTTELGTYSDSSGNLTINICLHGHSLTYSKGRVFAMYGGSSVLNIYDCGGTGAIDSGRGLYAYNSATINLYGGIVKGADGYNGVSVSGNAVFNMYGGAVRDNKGIGSDTGGVFIGSSGIFNMYGGIITNNTNNSSYGGAGVYASSVDSVFHMYGGSITNNIVDCAKANNDEETLKAFYKGAGVHVNGGTFTLEGNVNISGNIRKNGDILTANNVEVFYKVNSDGTPVKDYEGNILYDGKIKITGPLGAGSQIGFTMPSDHLTGIITSGYTESGNTQNPSTFFNCDNSGYSISYDEDLGTEAAVYEGEVVVGNYTMIAATAKSHVGTPKVGDTSIGLNIEVSLKNDDDNSTKTIQDTKTVTLSTPLQVGNNTISYNYVYKGVTKPVTYSITLDKVNAAVNWTCTGATSTGSNTAERVYDGSNALSGISASYLGYDGQTVTVSGASLTVKKGGTTVNAITEVGVYTITMPSSNTYEFSNGMLTLTVKEAPVDEGYYTMRSATAVVNGTYTAGATSINVTVTATLKNTVNINDVTTATENKQITVPALKAGNNEVTFTYTYTDEKGGTQTAQVTVNVTAGKKSAAVSWYFNGTLASNNSAQYTSNGIDVLGDISAKYTGLNGQTVTVGGLSGDIIVKNSEGVTVNSIIGAGVYTVSLVAKADYQFTNNTFTLTVNEANVEDGYYKFKSAVATGIVGSATVGDRELTVTVKVTLEHTKNHDVKQNTVNTKVTLTTALHVGANNVTFTYTHTSAPNDVQSAQLSLSVNAAKKQVAVKWYFNGVLATNNEAKLVYSGADSRDKIVAEYDGYDGTKQRVDGTSAGMIIKDAGGNAILSLVTVGEYTLSLADSADYVFTNNSFGVTVAGNLGDISDFTYEEDDDVILGVSCDNGLEQGTEMKVEWVEDLDDNLVSGQISSALNVSFVNNSVGVAPVGNITVHVLIPDELKDKDYKIYNLHNGVATELRFTVDGDYATFTSNELNTILFVTQETPIPTPAPGGNGSGITLNNNGLVWVWVSVAIVAASLAIMAIVIVALNKRSKK
ncbi:MAG: hypothetical protein K2J01_03335 [Clostridiales bacterium]|nr:hypothetical protein [Clostridiales bacterium]